MIKEIAWGDGTKTKIIDDNKILDDFQKYFQTRQHGSYPDVHIWGKNTKDNSKFLISIQNTIDAIESDQPQKTVVKTYNNDDKDIMQFVELCNLESQDLIKTYDYKDIYEILKYVNAIVQDPYYLHIGYLYEGLDFLLHR